MEIPDGTIKLIADEISTAVIDCTTEDGLDFDKLNHKIDAIWEEAREEGLNESHFLYILEYAIPENISMINFYSSMNKAA
ncbi:MAG: hypothetical protein E2O68_01420 [Deltaproteobacteria bacterium]|nr:MAG: hypothetical protein E2O68_01420 [Deltaproteobacteria bacterium]